MRKIKENIGDILIFIFFILILVFIAITPTSDTKENNRIRKMQYTKDSLEAEYYKKKLESFPYDHSEIKDTTKQNVHIKTSF